jgi:hypothetical protein
LGGLRMGRQRGHGENEEQDNDRGHLFPIEAS